MKILFLKYNTFKMNSYKLLPIFLLFLCSEAKAQTDSLKSKFTISGYAEAYYAYDFGKPDDGNRPSFAYSHHRHNEVNANFGFIKLGYDDNKVRGSFALMTGTLASINLAAEPDVLKNIFEANIGVKISKTKNIWVDLGVFNSHIGFESAIGADCWNLSRSILADNSPYYESGAKISYTSDNEKWFLSGLFLNGWQRMRRVDGNNTPAFGHQITFTPNSKITLNSSSFIGNDQPDSTRQMRYFHNFYGQFMLGERFGLIAGFDFGAQQKAKGSSDYNTWYSPVLIAKYAISEKTNLAGRIEYYSDENQVIVSTGFPTGIQTFGYSLNLDRQITENVLWRLEARGFSDENEIYTDEDGLSENNFFLSTSLSIAF